MSLAGNFEGKNVLQRRQPGPLLKTTEAALETLFQSRYGASSETLTTFPPARDNQAAKTQPWAGRIPAVTDTKMIVAWNSLMISGLARVAAVWGDRTAYEMALQAANFILQNQWVAGRLHRLNYEGQPSVLAQSEDYALFIKALLDLHQAAWQWPEAEPQMDWLQKAIAVQTEFDNWLWSDELAGYYNTASDASDSLLVRERTYQDSAVPAANGIAIANLVQLSLLTGDLTYLDRAEKSLQAFGAVMAQIPRACPSLFTALDWFRHATLVRTSADKIAALVAQYTPTAVFLADADLPANAVGMVCEGLYCKAPATDWEMLRSQLETSQQRPS
jgi:uncharacterized protein YyaL (SSP411 family)